MNSPFFLLYVSPVLRTAGGVVAYFATMGAMIMIAATLAGFFG